MELFLEILMRAQLLPDWAGLIVCPVLLLFTALIVRLLRGRACFWGFAAFYGGAGGLIAGGESRALFGYACAYGMLCGLLWLFFCLPKREKKAKQTRQEKMYQRFAEPLHEEVRSLPPKVVCYDNSPAVTAKECGMELDYVTSLLSRLRGEKLSPTDRLEVETLAGAVEGSKHRELNEEELSRLNDHLASALRLMAKYKC